MKTLYQKVIIVIAILFVISYLILTKDNSNEIEFKLAKPKIFYDLFKNPNDFVFKYVKLPIDYGFGSNLIPLAVAALATTGDILELGMGKFSTTLLHEISSNFDRDLISVDTNSDWVNQFAHYNSTNYHRVFSVSYENLFTYGQDGRWGLVLIDHTNASSRYFNVIRFAKNARMVVVHDAEKINEKIYLYEKYNIASHFKYACKFSLYLSKSHTLYVSTLLLSNYIDMTEINQILSRIKTENGHVACDYTNF